MTFTVAVDASDIEFPCAPGETVLDAAERAGYALPYSCRKGVCATCEGDLCRGEVAVGSKHFAGPSGDVLLCQARPRSDVLIHPRRIQRRDPDARKTVTAKVYRINRPVPRKWAARAGWFKFIPVLSEPDPGWNGAAGLVHHAVLRDLTDLSGWEIYACGNPLMIRHARRDFRTTAGLSDGDFFADPFVASGNDSAVPG
jgi:ferredoxin